MDSKEQNTIKADALLVDMMLKLGETLPNIMKNDILSVANSREYQDLCAQIFRKISNDSQAQANDKFNLFSIFNDGVAAIVSNSNANIASPTPAQPEQLSGDEFELSNRAAIDSMSMDEIVQLYLTYMQDILSNPERIDDLIIDRQSVKTAEGEFISISDGFVNDEIASGVIVDENRVNLKEYSKDEFSLSDRVKYDAVFSEVERLVREDFQDEIITLLSKGDDASMEKYNQLTSQINQARVQAGSGFLKDQVKSHDMPQSSKLTTPGNR